MYTVPMKYIIGLFLLLFSLNAYAANQEECLALNIYHEARGESSLGQLAVAFVTVNRTKAGVKRWGNTICKTVYARTQFDWTNDSARVSDWTAYHKSLFLARQVIHGHHSYDPTLGAVYYHAVGATPCWLPDVEKTVRIDNHIFYKKTDRKSESCYPSISQKLNNLIKKVGLTYE